MTQDEINALGIAFFSGNALQYKPSSESRHWLDWTGGYFPDLRSSNKDEWRIKPDEPKIRSPRHPRIEHSQQRAESCCSSNPQTRRRMMENLGVGIALRLEKETFNYIVELSKLSGVSIDATVNTLLAMHMLKEKNGEKP